MLIIQIKIEHGFCVHDHLNLDNRVHKRTRFNLQLCIFQCHSDLYTNKRCAICEFPCWSKCIYSNLVCSNCLVFIYIYIHIYSRERIVFQCCLNWTCSIINMCIYISDILQLINEYSSRSCLQNSLLFWSQNNVCIYIYIYVDIRLQK